LHCKSLGIKLEWSADSDDAACCNGPKKLAPGSQKEKWKGIEKDKIKERKKLDSAHVIKDVSRAQAWDKCITLLNLLPPLMRLLNEDSDSFLKK